MTAPIPARVVTRVGSGDLPAVARLRSQWTAGSALEPDPEFVDAITRWWAREDRVGWIGRIDGYAAGMANTAIFTRMPRPGRPPARWLYAANVFVDAAYRRRGLARALMTTMVAWARAEGMLRIVLAPSEMSIPLYESIGIRPAEDLMRLDLDAPR